MPKKPTSNNPRAVYMREWRAKNIERVRANERASQARIREADPEEYKRRARERYERWLAKGDNREREMARVRKGVRVSRRGLTKRDRHDYWLARRGLCDFCQRSYADPDLPGSWKTTVVDHDHDHCDNKIGCIGCVRGQGHRVCNVIEGAVKKALDLGLITGIWGPLADYLSDPPMQRWLRERDAGAATLAA